MENSCNICGTPFKEGKHICSNCGHVLFVDPNQKEIDIDESLNENVITVNKYEIKEKEYESNRGLLIRSFVSLGIFLIFVAGVVVLQFFLSDEVTKFIDNGNNFTLLTYVYLGSILILAFLFNIPRSIAKKAHTDIEDRHVDKTLKAAKTLSIIFRILSIIMIIATIALVAYDIYCLIPYITVMIENISSSFSA